jgi:hypothetical protein
MSGYVHHTVCPAKFQVEIERIRRTEARALARLARREARDGLARIGARLAAVRALAAPAGAR